MQRNLGNSVILILGGVRSGKSRLRAGTPAGSRSLRWPNVAMMGRCTQNRTPSSRPARYAAGCGLRRSSFSMRSVTPSPRFVPMIEVVPLHGGQLGKSPRASISPRRNWSTSAPVSIPTDLRPQSYPPCERAEEISTLTTYPDLEETALRQSIADYAGVQSHNIVVANGFIPL